MTLFYALAAAADLADSARRGDILLCGADILALQAAERPKPALLKKLMAAAAALKPRPDLALILPLAVLAQPGAAAWLRQTEMAGIKRFGFIAADYQAAEQLLQEEVNPAAIFSGLQAALIIPFSATIAADFAGRPAFLRQWGFAAAVLQLAENSQETAQSRAALLNAAGQWIEALRRAGFQAGLCGALQPADIPRLALHQPDIVGLPSAEFAEIRRTFICYQKDLPNMPKKQPASAAAAPLKRKSATGKGAAAAAEEAELAIKAAGTDKILVSDFIVPFHIGAYQHEKGAAQRVCFNVAAEISRLPRRPQNMGDIFSYDIIMDAITQLAGRGHWEFVESVAEELAAILLRFPRVEQVSIRVEKLDLAPRAVGIEICRRRG